jgi:hypothetical protein
MFEGKHSVEPVNGKVEVLGTGPRELFVGLVVVESMGQQEVPCHPELIGRRNHMLVILVPRVLALRVISVT